VTENVDTTSGLPLALCAELALIAERLKSIVAGPGYCARCGAPYDVLDMGDGGRSLICSGQRIDGTEPEHLALVGESTTEATIDDLFGEEQ
jgi:hypothetical protein